MPNLDEDGWELENAEEMNSQHPETFSIPSLEERTSLQAGARVKLGFLFLTEQAGEELIQCERMWCMIGEVSNGRYVGVLESNPVSSPALQAGDQIRFGPEHVATVLIRRDDPRHPEYGKGSGKGKLPKKRKGKGKKQ